MPSKDAPTKLTLEVDAQHATRAVKATVTAEIPDEKTRSAVKAAIEQIQGGDVEGGLRRLAEATGATVVLERRQQSGGKVHAELEVPLALEVGIALEVQRDAPAGTTKPSPAQLREALATELGWLSRAGVERGKAEVDRLIGSR